MRCFIAAVFISASLVFAAPCAGFLVADGCSRVRFENVCLGHFRMRILKHNDVDYSHDEDPISASFNMVSSKMLHAWLSELNGNHHYDHKSKGFNIDDVNRSDILDELDARRLRKDEDIQKTSIIDQNTSLVVKDRGNKDWRKYEDKHSGLTHFEELLVFQPKNWLLQAREYMFRYHCDLNRASPLSLSSSLKHRAVVVAGEEIVLRSPVEIVLFHTDLKRPDRYAPLNFLLAYGASDPLCSLRERLGEDKFSAIEKFLSPLPYFIDFQKYVASYDLQKLKQIGKLAKFTRVCLVKELDFSPVIVGQRLAKSIIRQAIVSYIHSRSSTPQPLSMIFAGSSGNGKTELARYLSDLINKPGSSGSYFHKCDCGKLSNAHELFGMSGAYYGSEAGSALNNFIVKMSTEPQSIGIVLLDEVEKAEREVITALYQAELNPDLYVGNGMAFEDSGRRLEAALRSSLRSKHPFDDAFIGRVSRIVPFLPMSKETADSRHPLLGEMMTITKMMIEREQEKFVDEECFGIEQVIDPETKHAMATIIVDDSIRETGVRSIVSQVSTHMSHRVLHSSLLEKGGVHKGATVQYAAREEEGVIDFRSLKGGTDASTEAKGNGDETEVEDDLSELYSLLKVSKQIVPYPITTSINHPFTTKTNIYNILLTRHNITAYCVWRIVKSSI
eukprot:scaffold83063_cov37-Cyclotella_meneghiniana.AAC.2